MGAGVSKNVKQVATTVNIEETMNNNKYVPGCHVLVSSPRGSYVKKHVLGKGATCTVFCCEEQKTGKMVAVKEVSKTILKYEINRLEASYQEDGIHREIAILKKMSHPNIVQLIECIDDRCQSKYWIVLELASKGALGKTVPRSEPVKQEVAKQQFRDILSALDYLHANGVIHRDLKLENCVLKEDGRVLLCDFAISHVFQREESDLGKRVKRPPGTIWYMAPEIFSNVSYSGRLADVWALGVLLYRLVFGDVPFQGKNRRDLLETMRCGKELLFPTQATWKSHNGKEETVTVGWNEHLVDLLRNILQKDPGTRIKLVQIIEHPWVNTKHSGKVLKKIATFHGPAIALSVNEKDVHEAMTILSFPHSVSVIVRIKGMVRRFRKRQAEKKLRRSLSFTQSLLPQTKHAMLHSFTGTSTTPLSPDSSTIDMSEEDLTLTECKVGGSMFPVLPVMQETMNSMQGPTQTSNWVVPHRICQGSYPGAKVHDETISAKEKCKRELCALKEAGITMFVCLQPFQETRRMVDYKKLAIRSVYSNDNDKRPSFIRAQIRDAAICPDMDMIKLLKKLHEAIHSGENLYIHCYGGHGRAGTVCSILLGQLYGLSSNEALSRVQIYHDSRVRNENYESPANILQRGQVHKLLNK